MNYVQPAHSGIANIPLTDVLAVTPEQRTTYFDRGWQVRVSYRTGEPILIPCDSKAEAMQLVASLQDKLEKAQ